MPVSKTEKRWLRLTEDEADAVDALIQQANSPWKTFSEFAREAIIEKATRTSHSRFPVEAVLRLAARSLRQAEISGNIEDLVQALHNRVKENEVRKLPQSMSIALLEELNQLILKVENPEWRGFWLGRVRKQWPGYPWIEGTQDSPSPVANGMGVK